MRHHRWLPESGGTVSYSSIDLISNVPTLEHEMRGVRLYSSGWSSSGTCHIKGDLGTSDPQEPQTPVNFSAASLKYCYPSSEQSGVDAFFVGGQGEYSSQC